MKKTGKIYHTDEFAKGAKPEDDPVAVLEAFIAALVIIGFVFWHILKH